MSKKLKPVNVIVDGNNLNGRHFAAMTKEKAVQAMADDHISADAAWAGKAWEACKAQVAAADAPPKPKTETGK